jgi:hypothetical protein
MQMSDMRRAALSVVPILSLLSPASADALSDTRALHQAISIRVAILETLLDPPQEPIRTADDIQRLVYEPMMKAENDWTKSAIDVAGKDSPYIRYSVCIEAASTFKLYAAEVQYALKTSKPLPEIAGDVDYRAKLSACATTIGDS